MVERLSDLGIYEKNIHVFDEIDSTNLAAIRHAKTRVDSGIEVFLARSQSAGRGRLGKSFVSSPDAGIYISLLIPANASSGEHLTAHTAASLAMTLDSLFDCETKIKWVNDIYLLGKKLCGILVEAVTSPEGKVTDFVIGMGINVYKNAITSEISDIATSLEDCGISVEKKDEITVRIIEDFIKRVIEENDPDLLLSEYRRRSITVGREIEVFPTGGEPYGATAIGINDDFTLLIRLPDGCVRSVFSGEVKTKITADSL